MAGTEAGRAQAKTARQRLLNILRDDFSQPRRIAQAIVEDAEHCLLGSEEEMQPGQMRVVLAASGESHAQAMKATRTKEVVWTVDGGCEDRDKGEIVALYEQGLDEAEIAFRAEHAQSSVGRYIRDYERVKLALQSKIPLPDIAQMTGLQPSVVKAYFELVCQYHPELQPVPTLDHSEA